MPRKIAAIHLILIPLLPLLAGNLARAADLPASPEIVGTVTIAIGAGRILSGAGQEQAALRGVPIRAGDRIETAAGGHVHIRFVDGGMVSVRPLSRLLIEAYRNDGHRDLAAIKFRLEEGVVRSITGEWGEARRDRFRLNTPVAAIGIKGTDFVVKTDRASTLASVAAGAIVMAPLEGPCAQALGPCTGDQSALLSAEMTGMMLELQRLNGHSIPRLVPAVDLLAGRGSGDAQRAVAGGAELSGLAEKSPVTDGEALNRLAESKAAPPAGKPLKWLHNVFDWNVPAHSFSQRYSEALADGRTAVVGNLFITLYRDETTQAVFAPWGKGTVAFALKNASASYTQPVAYSRPPEIVTISGATLNVDFNRATFATRMDLASPSLGNAEFAASGAISADGLFIAHGAGQNLAGAFSMDGGEAGYHFAKTFPGGQVSGITLWGR
jgi:hypothetical protein